MWVSPRATRVAAPPTSRSGENQFPYHTIYHTIAYHSILFNTSDTIPPNKCLSSDATTARDNCARIHYHITPHHTTQHTQHQTIPYHTTCYHTIPYHTTQYHVISYQRFNASRPGKKMLNFSRDKKKGVHGCGKGRDLLCHPDLRYDREGAGELENYSERIQ